MRILTRYILREVTSHALLGGALFTFIIFTRDLGKILEFVVRDSASYSDVARIIAYTLPNALVVTIPMAVLVGILLGLSRLAPDSQITGMPPLNCGEAGASPGAPNRYDSAAFTTTDIPGEAEAPEDTRLGRVNAPMQALSLPELWRRGNSLAATNGRDASLYRIEFNKRF